MDLMISFLPAPSGHGSRRRTYISGEAGLSFGATTLRGVAPPEPPDAWASSAGTILSPSGKPGFTGDAAPGEVQLLFPFQLTHLLSPHGLLLVPIYAEGGYILPLST